MRRGNRILPLRAKKELKPGGYGYPVASWDGIKWIFACFVGNVDAPESVTENASSTFRLFKRLERDFLFSSWPACPGHPRLFLSLE